MLCLIYCLPPQLKILRQLVELQLCHGAEIKAIIDRAWGVIHNKHKKNEQTPAPPPPSDPFSQENLVLNPIGQDIQRRRFWVADGEYAAGFLPFPTFHTVCVYLPSNLELLKHMFGILRPLIMVSSLHARLTVPSSLYRLTPGVHVYQSVEGHVRLPMRLIYAGAIYGVARGP